MELQGGNIYRALADRFDDLEVSHARLKEQLDMMLRDKARRRPITPPESGGGMEFPGWSCIPGVFTATRSIYKVAFCSERSIELSTQNGDLVRLPYKVSIPVEKILEVNEGQDVKRASRKYIEIVTVDNFEFWFMGFLNCRRTLNYIQQTLS